MSEHIIVTDDGPVRHIRINRAEKRNALTRAMYDAMSEAIETGGAASGVRCILLTGVAGAFTAGNDLQDFLQAALSPGPTDRRALRFLYAVTRCQCPIVAGVQGVAVGIGTTMLMHCDYVVAGTDASFSTPFTKLGLSPEAASSLLAPRLMGGRRAFALLVMGRPLDAAAAQACGLVNEVVTPDAVDAAALNAAREIAALPAEAVAASRRLLRDHPDEIVARIDEEAVEFDRRLRSQEARSAFEAFFARKK